MKERIMMSEEQGVGNRGRCRKISGRDVHKWNGNNWKSMVRVKRNP